MSKNVVNFLSNSIKVFPTTKRDDRYDRNARFPSEFNLTSLVNRLTSRDAFVISGFEVNSASNTLSGGSCNINGYYFVVNDADNPVNQSLSDLKGETGSVLCLSATFKATPITISDGSKLTFIELNGGDVKVSDYHYTGLSIEVVKTTNLNPYHSTDEDSNNIIYYLPIAKWDIINSDENISGWVNLPNDTLKYIADDMLVDIKEGLVETNAKASSKSIVGEQSLQQWLDAFIIDDGEI